MTHLAILRDNNTRLSYAFASESFKRIESEMYDCLLNNVGFIRDELEILEYEEGEKLQNICADGEYTIRHIKHTSESFKLSIIIPNTFEIV